ncbi:hypothetical protein CVT26_004116 [Gymnopilus dilepis]|uniref:Uncharacterized protein n=1 Tax=Gymnopilus dilepis TaxID=231916 RepID=A0A409YVE0_9AGAR|nr:hypothetical protein CVT26_004116 [Gymnopilus dilepis]
MDELEEQKKAAPTIMDDDSFAAEYRATLSAMNQHHDPIASKLPPEVAAKIFEACGPHSMNAVEDCRLLTGAICKAWRTISWATPSIWSRLTVRITAPAPSLPLLVEQWLDRSGSLPLDICFCESSFYTAFYVAPLDKHIGQLFEILNRVSHRLISLQLSMESKLYNLFTGNDKGLPLLQSLVLWTYDDDQSEGRIDTFGDAPTPTYVEINHARLSCINISWNRVTTVRLETQELHEVVSLLSLARHMQRLEAKILRNFNPVALPSFRPRISHDHLEELVLETCLEKDRIEAFFDCFDLKVLRRLDIDFYEAHNVWKGTRLTIPFPSFQTLIARSGCALKELRMVYSDYHTTELVDFLSSHQLASIESLDIRTLIWQGQDSALPDELFKRLAETCHDDSDTPFLPNLRRLIFGHMDCYNVEQYPNRKFPWEHALGMLGSPSCPSKRPLSHVEMTFSHRLEGLLHDNIFVDMECVDALLDLQQQQPGLLSKFYIYEHGKDLLEAYRKVSDGGEVKLIDY